MLIAKEKEKGLFEKEHQEAAGHNRDPSNNPYYCGSECNFKWKEISKFKWPSEKNKKVNEKTLAREK